MKQINLEQNTPEWHEFRRMKIGASDAPVIMGVSPYKTRLQLWEEKLSGQWNESCLSEAMNRGKAMEPKALKFFNEYVEKNHALIIGKEEFKPAVFQDEDYKWMIASVDGWNGACHVEIKCNGSITHEECLRGQIPLHHIPQLQHQLWVLGTRSGYYVSFDGVSGVVIEFDRDEEMIAKIVEAEKVFYHSLFNFEPPEPTEKDYEDRQYDINFCEAISMYKFAKQKRQEAEKDENFWRDQLIVAARSRSCKANSFKVTKYYRKGNVDYGKIKELEGVNLEQYRSEGKYLWRLS